MFITHSFVCDGTAQQGSGTGQVLNPDNPGDNIKGMTGIRPTDVLLGDSVTTWQGVEFVAVGTPLIDQTTTAVNFKSTIARRQFAFTDATSDAIEAPDATFGDIDGTRNMAFAAWVRSTSTGLTNIFGKRIVNGYEQFMDAVGKLSVRVMTDLGVAITPITDDAYNDGDWFLVLVHVVPMGASARVVLAVQGESSSDRKEAAWPGGTATTTRAFSVGGNRLVALGSDHLGFALFVDTPSSLNESEFAQQLFSGFNPQSPAGYGPIHEIVTGGVP